MEPITTTSAGVSGGVKLWSILSAVCGSVVPILALSDKQKVGFQKALLMAFIGSSFAIFVAPWTARFFEVNTQEGLAALSWIMGATGVFIIKVLYKWMDTHGDSLITGLFDRIFGKSTQSSEKSE